MNIGTMLNLLENCSDESSKAYQIYLNLKNPIGTDDNIIFANYAKDLRELIDLQYDFNFLSVESKKLDSNLFRRDFKDLLEVLCERIGNKLSELSIKGIFSKSVNIEGSPFGAEDLCYYTKKPIDTSNINIVNYDGSKYKCVECKLEHTAYYSIYCTSLELFKY